MPIRYVEIPEDVVLKNRATGESYKDEKGNPETVSFLTTFIGRLMDNPKWVESYANMKSARAIDDAIAAAKSADGKILPLAEEDWQKLKEAVEDPKRMVYIGTTAQVQAGFGYHPSLASQLVTLVAAVMEAKATLPKESNAKTLPVVKTDEKSAVAAS